MKKRKVKLYADYHGCDNTFYLRIRRVFLIYDIIDILRYAYFNFYAHKIILNLRKQLFIDLRYPFNIKFE